jgi:hypothetical protein
MLCPVCHGKGTVGRLPCGECGGHGVAHCCEGLTEQPGPSVDECRDRLHRAGWSFGWTGCGPTWIVSGTKGENLPPGW